MRVSCTGSIQARRGVSIAYNPLGAPESKIQQCLDGCPVTAIFWKELIKKTSGVAISRGGLSFNFIYSTAQLFLAAAQFSAFHPDDRAG